MKDQDELIKTAIKAIFTLSFATSILVATNVVAAEKNEKCYGIAKAHMNDCSAASCAGSALKDNQPDAYLLLPTGLCQKIVGGSLKPRVSDTQKEKK